MRLTARDGLPRRRPQRRIVADTFVVGTDLLWNSAAAQLTGRADLAKQMLLGYSWVMLAVSSDANGVASGVTATFNDGTTDLVIGAAASYLTADGLTVYIWAIVGNNIAVRFDAGGAATYVRGAVSLWRDYPGAVGP